MIAFPTILEDGTLLIPCLPEDAPAGQEGGGPDEFAEDGCFVTLLPGTPEFDKALRALREAGIEPGRA